MPETIAKVGKQYPEVAQQLEALPPHVIDGVGEVALSLTYNSLLDSAELTPSATSTNLEANFDQIVSDPQDDSVDLELESAEAAQAGKQKLAEVLHQSSSFLSEAQRSLTERGFSFGAKEVETSDQELNRERREHDAIYETALLTALESAKNLKEQGNSSSSAQALESLILIRYMSQTPEQRDEYRYSEERRIFRQAVHEGLGEELLTAAQATEHLYSDKDSRSLGDSIRRIQKLLELANGKAIDWNFNVTGDYNPANFRPSTSIDEVRDLVAVATTKGSKFSLADVLPNMSGLTIKDVIEKRLNADPSTGVDNSQEYIYDTLELLRDGDDVRQPFECDDPKLVLEAERALDIKDWQAVAIFGHPKEGSDLKAINPDEVHGLIELKSLFPKHFPQILDMSLGQNRGIKFNPNTVKESISALSEAGLDKPELIVALCKGRDVTEYAEAYKSIVRELHDLGLGEDDLPRLFKVGMQLGGVRDFSSDYAEEMEFIEGAVKDKATIREKLEKVVMEDQAMSAYMASYSKIQYPLEKGAYVKTELGSIPLLQKKMTELGLSPELAKDIFDSWKTYDEFIINADREFTYSDEYMQEPPNEAILNRIVEKQAEALSAQFESLLSFANTYGLETMQQVIANFGIYNFSRHNAEKLADQNERWMAGEKVRSVVAEARSDWNAISGKETIFEELQGEGVFYFEANSGLQLAQLAVEIGRRERANGREPDVTNFIIHAHGSPNSMVMGVNGEEINTSLYREAAAKSERIGATERNDYRKHLGENFEIILQSCSTAGDNGDEENIAELMSEAHDTRVIGSPVTISFIKIKNDGSVKFSVTDGNGEPITYQSGQTVV